MIQVTVLDRPFGLTMAISWSPGVAKSAVATDAVNMVELPNVVGRGLSSRTTVLSCVNPLPSTQIADMPSSCTMKGMPARTGFGFTDSNTGFCEVGGVLAIE